MTSESINAGVSEHSLQPSVANTRGRTCSDWSTRYVTSHVRSWLSHSGHFSIGALLIVDSLCM